MKYYDLIIISSEPFPVGRAASNRILSYSSALAREGKKVLLLTFSGPSYGLRINCDRTGSVGSIDYVWTDNTYYPSRPILPIRAFLYFKRLFVLLFDLVFRFSAPVYLQVNRSATLSFTIYILSRIRRSLFFREISESFENDRNVIRRICRKYVCQFTDGIIVISSGIRSYFSFIKEESHFFFLPVLVDKSRFAKLKRDEDNNHFFYCSGGVLERDGFLDAVCAFLMFHNKYPKYKLRCAFVYNERDEYHRRVMELIRQNSSIINYIGAIPTTDIPKELVCASALLLTPSHNYVSKGFPTKLAEYFASSTPVICTSIDDLTEYLTEKEVIFANPGDVNSIETAMLFVAENPEKSTMIGLGGGMYVDENFTMKNFAIPLMDFLKI